MEYGLLKDEDTVLLAQNGDQEALEYIVDKYSYIIRAKLMSFFLLGAESEDAFQEGLIGLFKSVRDYDGDRKCSFKTFASLCVERQIISAVKSASRMKHMPLNSYVSLDEPLVEDNSRETNRIVQNVIKGLKAKSPEDIVIQREKMRELKRKANEMLTKLEKDILYLYMKGNSYQEVSEKLRISTKTVDNALQRIKRKARNN